jgi:hypothetical protein
MNQSKFCFCPDKLLYGILLINKKGINKKLKSIFLTEKIRFFSLDKFTFNKIYLFVFKLYCLYVKLAVYLDK